MQRQHWLMLIAVLIIGYVIGVKKPTLLTPLTSKL